MKIQKDNLTIRSVTINDIDLLYKWWNDGNVMAHAGFPNGLGTTPDKIIQEITSDNCNHFIVEVDLKPIGEMSYRNKNNKVAEIGIKICNLDMQDKGYGTKFLKMLINYLLDELNYEKIVLDTNLNNKRAQHVYEKLDFKKFLLILILGKINLVIYNHQ